MNGTNQSIGRLRTEIQKVRARVTDRFRRSQFSHAQNLFRRKLAQKPVFACMTDGNLKIIAAGGSALPELGLVMGKQPSELLPEQSCILAEITGRMALKGLPAYFDCEQAGFQLSVEVEPVRDSYGVISGVMATAFHPASLNLGKDASSFGFVEKLLASRN
jgi:hypothetical protein